jgi:hypothetical protein
VTDSEQIDEQLKVIQDWRGEKLKWFRNFVHEKQPELVESFKWGCCVFTFDRKPVCAMNAFKDHVKYNFFKGSSLPDPTNFFNSGLDSKEHRSINLAESDTVDQKELENILQAAVTLMRK